MSDLAGAGSTVKNTLTTMQTQIKTTTTDLQGLGAKDELKNAFANPSACSSLTNG